MKRKLLVYFVTMLLLVALTGCSTKAPESVDNTAEIVVEETAVQGETEGTQEETTSLSLEDGEYLVRFDTDSSMFHVNEMMDGKALLTVKEGQGNLHLVMPSKNVLYLYKGLAEEAEKNKADWIAPSIEEVTYEDGITEEVFSFDVPVNVIDEEFDLALIGKKEKWYDHKVSISNPEPLETEQQGDTESEDGSKTAAIGTTIEVSLEGGTGKVYLISPTAIQEAEDGYLVTLEWSSKHYDYMIVEGEKYLPVSVDEHSIFEIPVKSIEEPLSVIADTVAMSTPHEIEYTITFNSNSMK